MLLLCAPRARAADSADDATPTKTDVTGCSSLNHADDLVRRSLRIQELARRGKLLEALAAARDDLACGMAQKDDALIHSASADVQDLLPRVPHLRILLSSEEVDVRVDGIPVSPERLRGRLALNPGSYTVEVEVEVEPYKSSLCRWDPVRFVQEVTVAEGDDLKLYVPAPVPPVFDPRCADVPDPIRSRIDLQTSAYSDTTDVHVFTPQVRAAVAPASGLWNIGGSYALDVISAASPDIVATASPAYHETRHVGSLALGYQPGTLGVEVHGALSSEPDLQRRTAGALVRAELDERRVLPQLGYTFTEMRIGRTGTPFAEFVRERAVHRLDGRVAIVLSPLTLVDLSATAIFERGYQANPYRRIPTFAPSVAERVTPGESYGSVNALRLADRVDERLPDVRNRFAVEADLRHRTGGTSTLRLNERAYADSWAIASTTTDARELFDLTSRVRVWPHLRFHAQSAADFYRLATVATTDADNRVVLPNFRTTDRELSPMVQLTAGGGVRLQLTGEERSGSYQSDGTALVLSVDVLHSRYFDSLYIRSRTGVYGTVGFEANF